MDRRAFSKAYDKYADSIFRHCYFRVYEREEAKDLTQQVFTRAWEYVCEGRKIDNVRAFLYQVARNLIVDYYRKKKESSLDQMRDKGFQIQGDKGDEGEKGLVSQEVQKLLMQLKEEHREVVVMRYIDGLKPKEIAKIIGDNSNSVSVRIHRASSEFKKICKRNGYEYS